MNKNNWTVVAVFAIVALLVFLIATSMMGGWGYGGWGMMGPGMTLAHGAHMPWRAVPGSADVGRWGFSSFGWIGMIFMWLIPVGFLVLTVLGIVWLVRTLGNGNKTSAPTKTCPSCGRGVQAAWHNCPHCGTILTSP